MKFFSCLKRRALARTLLLLLVADARATEVVEFNKIVARGDSVPIVPGSPSQSETFEVFNLRHATVNEGGVVVFGVQRSSDASLSSWLPGTGIRPLLNTGSPVPPGIDVPCTRSDQDCGPPRTSGFGRFSSAPGGLTTLEYYAVETKAGTRFTGTGHTFLANIIPSTGASFAVSELEILSGFRVLGFCPQANAVVTADVEGGKRRIRFRSATENRPIVREMEPIPGLPNTQVQTVNPLLYATNSHGEGIVPARVEVDGVSTSGLLFVDDSGAINLVALFDTPHPSHPDLDPAGVWRGITGQILNDSGAVLFVSRITPPDGGTTDAYSLWLGTFSDPENPRLLALEGRPTEIPGLGAVTPTWFSAPLLSADGSVYVVVTYRSGPPDGGAFQSNYEVLCQVNPTTGELTRLFGPANAFGHGAPVPAIPDSKLIRIEPAIVSASDRLAFFVDFVDADGAMQTAVVAENRDGTLGAITHTGATITVNETTAFQAEVDTMEFAHDIGANKIHRNGQTGLSTAFGASGRLVLTMGLKLTEDPTTAVPHFIAVDFLTEPVPAGNEYHWSGETGANDWHTVSNGRSNWVDTAGTPWPTPPGPGANVFIPGGAFVQLNAPASVNSISLTGPGAELVVAADLDLLTLGEVRAGARLELNAGTVASAEGALELTGEMSKVAAGDASVAFATLSFLGDEKTVSVKAGALNLNCENIRLETDLTLETVAGAAILVGNPEAGGALNFIGGLPGRPRKLTLSGAGEITLRNPFTINESEAFVLDESAPFDRAGLIVDLPMGELIHFGAEFELLGRLDLRGGGMTGALVNEGRLVVGAEGKMVTLDVTNRGVIEQHGDVRSDHVINEDGATYVIHAGTLAPDLDRPTINQLVFRPNSQLDAQGAGAIAFPNSVDPETFASAPNFESASITVNNDAQLRLAHVELSGKITISVPDSDGEVILENIDYETLRTWPFGTTILRGTIHCTAEDSGATGNVHELARSRPRLSTETNWTRFEGANLTRENGSHWLVDWSREDGFSTSDYPTTIDGLRIGPGIHLDLTTRTKVLGMELSRDSFVRFSSARLEGDVLADNAPKTPENRMARASAARLMAKSPSVGGEIRFEPILEPEEGPFGDSHLNVTVEEATRFEVAATGLANEETKALETGSWTLQGGASLRFKPWNPAFDFERIEKDASLTIGLPPADGTDSFFGFPRRKTPLTVEGRLVLDGVTLEMEGRLLTVDGGTIDFRRGARIQGAIRSVSPDIDGVLSLARLEGGVDITGNAEIGGALGVGASPGFGVIGGDLTLDNASVVHLEIGGEAPVTEFDQLTVGGTTTLNGKLILSSWDDYKIHPNDEFLLIETSDLVGNFVEIDQTDLGREYRLALRQEANGLVARAAPLTIDSYEDWKNAFFTATDAANPTLSGPDMDPDGDGRSNRMEYAMGGSPYNDDGTALTITQQIDAGPGLPVLLSFDWYGVPDAAYVFEASPDLTTWTEAQILKASSEDQGDYSRVTVLFEEPDNVAVNSVFLRAKVVAP